jgi:hypothetical protein
VTLFAQTLDLVRAFVVVTLVAPWSLAICKKVLLIGYLAVVLESLMASPEFPTTESGSGKIVVSKRGMDEIEDNEQN